MCKETIDLYAVCAHRVSRITKPCFYAGVGGSLTLTRSRCESTRDIEIVPKWCLECKGFLRSQLVGGTGKLMQRHYESPEGVIQLWAWKSQHPYLRDRPLDLDLLDLTIFQQEESIWGMPATTTVGDYPFITPVLAEEKTLAIVVQDIGGKGLTLKKYRVLDGPQFRDLAVIVRLARWETIQCAESPFPKSHPSVRPRAPVRPGKARPASIHNLPIPHDSLGIFRIMHSTNPEGPAGAHPGIGSGSDLPDLSEPRSSLPPVTHTYRQLPVVRVDYLGKEIPLTSATKMIPEGTSLVSIPLVKIYCYQHPYYISSTCDDCLVNLAADHDFETSNIHVPK